MKNSGFILYITILLMLAMGNSIQAQIAVIVNKKNSVNDLTLHDLKNFFLGKTTTFSNNKRVILVEYAPLKEKFYRIVLGQSLDKVKKYWISVVFSGGSATPPREIKDLVEIKKFVSENEGAISFIDFSGVDATVKVVAIEGTKPGSKSYPLK